MVMATILFVLAAVVRYVALNSIPPGLWYDEALYCISALSIGDPDYPVFFMTGGHPHEPLFVYSLRGWFSIFGVSVLSARTCMATWGMLTVIVFWFLAKRFLVSYPWCVAALGVIAFMRWPLHFSRTIFRAGLAALFMSLTVLSFMRWRDKRRNRDAALCGAIVGLGLYTYLSFRLIPIILFLWVIYLFAKKALTLKKDGPQLLLMALCAATVFSPLGIDWIIHPDHFRGRTDEVSMFVAHNNDGTITSIPATRIALDIMHNALGVAGAWFVKGDHVGKHNLPYSPVFDPVTGLIFLLGLLWCVRNCLRYEKAFFLLIWFLVLCMTSVLSFGAPNILRMQGAIPPVILIFVIGLRLVFKTVAKHTTRQTAGLLIFGILTAFSVWQLDTYFRRFPVDPAVRREFLADTFVTPAKRTNEALKTDLADKVWVPQEMGEHTAFTLITWNVRDRIVRYAPEQTDLTTDTKALIIATRHSMDTACDPQRQYLKGLPRVSGWTVPIEDESGKQTPIPWGFIFRPTGK